MTILLYVGLPHHYLGRIPVHLLHQLYLCPAVNFASDSGVQCLMVMSVQIMIVLRFKALTQAL